MGVKGMIYQKDQSKEGTLNVQVTAIKNEELKARTVHVKIIKAEPVGENRIFVPMVYRKD